jgi:hypothetical protein
MEMMGTDLKNGAQGSQDSSSVLLKYVLLTCPVHETSGQLGRTYSEEVLSRVLYATQFTRRLDAYGYANFKNWRSFGEDGLAGEQVSI